ncbi:MAG: HAD hydrolase-like protein [Gemmatimonadota bacterium]|nr:HAD hydrolase-like protein [Gemmatimonadota bacterium]
MGQSAANLRVLILDFDGVVIDSNAAKTQAFNEVFSRFPEHAGAMMAYHHINVSVSRFDKFDHLLTLLGRSEDTELKANVADDFARRVVERMKEVPLVSGATSFLGKVTQRVPVYLASVTPAEELAGILEKRGLAHWFRGVYGCPPWSKPRAILDVLARERVAPREALLIGDSAGDQRAARATGVEFLGVDSGLSFDEPLPQQFPDLTRIADYLDERLP